VAKDIADAFRTDAENTAGEILVARDSSAKSGTPEQFKNLTKSVTPKPGVAAFQ